MSKVDLHIHSSVSDGRYGPEELVFKAAERGLTYISLTDHDSIDGIDRALPAASAFPALTVIPGVEISTEMPDGEAHILGYFVDYADPALKSSLENFRLSRERRARQMVQKLDRLGIRIDWQRVQDIAAGGSIGRPHIAQAMLEKGYISSLRQAFNEYIGHGCPAYVEREKMTPAEAVALVARSGGLPALAHPFTVKDPEAIIAVLKPAGLIGLETYYGGYSPEQTGQLIDMATRHDLVPVGGSDYHGLDDATETMMGSVEVPEESARRLIALAGERTRLPNLS
ncbi:MAG: PHP domain-containing protein [Chloroflexi bacterium]|nr:PHP domain-containing protein [Chloroflexota bacterium]